MGTSRSSTGPSSGAPLVPSWVDDGTPQDTQAPAGQSDQTPVPDSVSPSDVPTQVPPAVPLVAPKARFSTTRRNVGEYVRTASSDSLSRALGSYGRKGYGGSKTVTSRMAQASATSSRAFSVLSGLSDGSITPESVGIDREKLRGRPISDVVEAIVDAVCGSDTTIDDVSSREAVNDALCDALTENPALDLLSLPEEDVKGIWVRTFSYHVVAIVLKDIGSHMQKAAAGDHVLFNTRCRQIREFVFERMRSLVEAKEKSGVRVSAANSRAISKQVIKETFEIFDGGDDD